MTSHKENQESMEQLLADIFGLMLILAGSMWGIAAGSCLQGSLGSLLGLLFGSLWGFWLAEHFGLWFESRKESTDDAPAKGSMVLLAQMGTPLSGPKRPWLDRILGRKPARPSPLESDVSYSFEEINRRLRAVNSQLWKELRQGILSSCYAGLHTVHVDEKGESLDWREVNRRTVAALHRFDTATSDEERRISLNEALDRIGQKLLLVQRAALRKADRLNVEEEREIQKNEAELWRLSRLDLLSSS